VHEAHRRGGVIQGEKFQQLVGDSLARQRHQVIGPLNTGLECMGIRIAMTVTRMEPEVAQDPQMVLGNALKRLADEADRP
jgi:hypothetical protein